jgi:Dolichyl-phosphate-mannose-protein mannosyltransferase
MGNYNQKKISCGEFFALAILVVIGFLPRYALLVASNYGIDSDEAIVGLMAKHITEGRPWPIFYYGQPYMGSLEAIFVAGAFYLFGISNAALLLVPTAFSLLFIVLTYFLARQVVSKANAFLSAFLIALPPSALTLWSTKARGGFIELLCLGTLSLIITSKIISSETPPRLRNYFYLGLVLGLGWWVNNQIAFYILAVAPFCIWQIIKEIRFEGFKRGVNSFFLGVLGFFLGSSPFWYYNLTVKPYFSTFKFLGSSASVGSFGEYFTNFFAKSVPIIFGARPFWSHSNTADVFEGASVLTYAVYGIVFLLAIVFIVSSSGTNKDRAISKKVWLLLVFCWAIPVIFSSTSFGSLSEAPRYLLPLYSAVFVILAFVVDRLGQSRSLSFRVLGYLLAGIVLVLNLVSNYSKGIVIPGEPFVYGKDRVQHDHTDLYSWLKANNYRHIYTNYWIGYRVAFETNEEITFSRFLGPRPIRLPEYEDYTFEFEDYAVYVLSPEQAQDVAISFSDRGYSYRSTEVGGYVILDHVLLDGWDDQQQINLSSLQVWATSRQDWAKNLVDGELGTRWGSGAPQSPGMEIKILFDDVVKISGIDLDYGLFPQDRPLRLQVLATKNEGEKCMIYDSADDAVDLFDERELKIKFPELELSGLSFRQSGKHPILDWSIAELKLFENK